MALKSFGSVHFIGIGGIGISALAKFLFAQGIKISGSDMAEGCITKELQSMGILIHIPHCKEAIKNPDLVIHSAIIKDSNIEVQEAKKKGIPVLSRKEALPLILANKQVYAVAGAHGKSTTTAILSAILQDCSALIGAESKEFGSNTRALKSEKIVFEADESDKSFLECNPYCAIVTNAEPEHMETYGHNLDKFYQAYKDFLALAQYRIINAEDAFLAKVDLECVRLYPSKDISEIEYFLDNNNPKTRFRLKNNHRDLGVFEVYGLGEHIALDASLAILAALECMELEEIRQNIQKFCGIKKRFDILSDDECVIIDDYAHHPTEIAATLKSLRKYQELIGKSSLRVIWQPHKYSRVRDNLKEFVECFEGVDKLVILPVYAAGEAKVEIDFRNLFAKYNPIFADFVKREKDSLGIYQGAQRIAKIKDGIIVGFNAGNLTYQLRGEI
ncbi:UDP-N-acetylmuramate--L-alanine ligase [Helicobacter pullorum]|uniref:UDP-N-acetylmuramate--L-alanine ligase n=1 Tax=Helicobacter pullorum TaxID=35818 RepID=UPI000816AEDE|nr:UDP-N-acetylmuramate--L-alanine ligase [Helicobacter pullorum]OCR16228.1 UDP-N-acetylmuramate--L-alanine ligase [Helicobacter pullorum]